MFSVFPWAAYDRYQHGSEIVMRKDRPTWTLGEQTLSATYPARDVDLDEAFQRAICITRSHSRMNEVSDLIKQMSAFHIEAAGDAYTGLAMLARGSGVAPWDGWNAELFDCDIPGATELLLTREGASGAIHVSIRNDPALKEDSEKRVIELERAVTQELDTLGVPKNKQILREIFNKGEETPSETLLKKLKSGPENYRLPEAGDPFRKLIVTAVNIKGAPAGIPSEDSNNLSDFAGKDVDKDYFRGEQLSISKDIFTREDNILSASNARISGSTETVLHVLSGLLEENGFAPMIADECEQISGLSWRAYGEEHGAEIMDVANAATYQSNGLFDDVVAGLVARYSRAIAAMDMEGIADLLVPLASGLVDKGFTSKANTFDANDMRDIAHASEDDDGMHVFSRTQNGTYRLDIKFDELGAPCSLEANEVTSGSDRPVGRFALSLDGWREDYDGTLSGETAIVHDIKTVRHMNNLISSLSSLSCVFQDEFENDGPEL